MTKLKPISKQLCFTNIFESFYFFTTFFKLKSKLLNLHQFNSHLNKKHHSFNKIYLNFKFLILTLQMGNKPTNSNPQPSETNAPINSNPSKASQPTVPPKKSGCFGAKQSDNPSRPKSQGNGCFGGSKQKSPQKSVVQQIDSNNRRSYYTHDTKKSTIKVNSLPNAKVDDKLFADRQNKARLDIKMKRAQAYQIMKDSDYFDSELNDRTDLERLKKAYDSCEIANYQTPQTEKLQTVQIKTYLFDRNLTKIEA